MKKLFFLFLLFVLYAPLGICQQKGANISFENESYNFGKITEAKGPVSYVFNFTNTGSEPLVIQNVQPSCGCTTPEWSREPVVPGGKGFIKATFNPAGRPGPFNKSINVASNGLKNLVILRFSGEVAGKEPSVVDLYPFVIENLRFTSLYVAYGRISPGKPVLRKLEVINTGKEPVSISFPVLPSHIKATVNPASLKTNQKAVIEITYDAGRKNDWGFVSDAVDFSLNGQRNGKYRLNVSATIQDDYSNATPEQLANAPKIGLEKNTFEFGRMKAGTKIEVLYRLKNVGKTNLLIHKINSDCGCTEVKSKEKSVKPGTTGEITAIFNSAGMKGAVNKTLTVISNDPKNPNLVLWIKGTVD